MPKKIIYAEDAIEALCKVGCKSGYCGISCDDVKAIEQLPSAQPQLETCPIYGGMCGYPSNLCYECPRHERAKEQPQWWTEGLQPFAQPQRMKGRWIEKTVSENPQACGIREWQSAKCSVCGKYHSTPYLYSFTEYAFCPLCGADMRGEQNE